LFRRLSEQTIFKNKKSFAANNIVTVANANALHNSMMMIVGFVE